MFIDDNPEARALVSTVLEAAGADVFVAASAAEALEDLQDHNIDVVLTDIGMPGLDGYDFVMRLREIERASDRTPVCAIALTAHAGAEDRRRALTGGFQGYLAKPIDPDELVRAARDVYEASRT
jgi:CheY-like chemotaxis protein